MTSILVAIDPGFAKRGQGCAVAVFRDGRLVDSGFERPERAAPLRWPPPASVRVVWECPQVDARTRVSVPAIVQLAAVGGTLAGMYAGANATHAEPVSPLAWKGAVAKPVAHGRMWALLDERERTLLGGDATLAAIEAAKRAGALSRWSKPGAAYYAASWTMHNVLDAVGIGLWALGRVMR